MKISINPELEHLLNGLISKRHTLFEHKEFVEIKSMYAKNCYRLLKQYRSTGYMKISLEEFRRILDVPESYKIYSVNQKVLTPIKNELKKYFKGLNIKSNKVKGKTAYYEFFFQKEKPEVKEPNIDPKLLDNKEKMKCDSCNIGYFIKKFNKESDTWFLACDKFPQCKNTKNIKKEKKQFSIEDDQDLEKEPTKLTKKHIQKGTMTQAEIL